MNKSSQGVGAKELARNVWRLSVELVMTVKAPHMLGRDRRSNESDR